jgi:hypothetical protein
MEDDYLFPRHCIVNGYRLDKEELGDLEAGRMIVYTEIQLQKRFENVRLYGNPKPVAGIKKWLWNYSISYNIPPTLSLAGDRLEGSFA